MKSNIKQIGGAYETPRTISLDFLTEGVLCESPGDASEGNAGSLFDNEWGIN